MMTSTLHIHAAALRIKPMPRYRIKFALRGEDSPSAPFLRLWVAHQVARHRDLLLNIDAAHRLRLAPIPVGSGAIERRPLR
jgi:hypothetical protein